ncbi:MAG TPA: DUF6496 domain-containing protein [Candidatus Saccharimonadales bacterium]|jgi:hypothetical protein
MTDFFPTTRRKPTTRQYDPKESKAVEKTMHEHKHEGTFKNHQQAVAAGLDKARRKGESVPERKE